MAGLILGLLLLSSVWQQTHQKAFTASVPCNNSLIMSIEGTYPKSGDTVGNGTMLPTAQHPEAYSRLVAIHRLLVGAYPQPHGKFVLNERETV